MRGCAPRTPAFRRFLSNDAGWNFFSGPGVSCSEVWELTLQQPEFPKSRRSATMPSYRCYLFNEDNFIREVVDFDAASDAEACERAKKLHNGGHGVLELWRDENKIYCPERKRARNRNFYSLPVFRSARSAIRSKSSAMVRSINLVPASIASLAALRRLSAWLRYRSANFSLSSLTSLPHSAPTRFARPLASAKLLFAERTREQRD